MDYKILENNAIDNTNIEGAAFNKFVAGKKSGIIEFANNCSLSATGNVLIISNGILLISGVRVRITEPESFTISSAPVIDTRYQVIAQLINTDGENFDFSLFIQDILPLVQNDIVADAGVYQLELGRFTHTTTGEIDDVIRTADILTAGSSGGADFEIGEVTTETLAEGLDAEVDIEKRQIENKTYIDFAFGIPKGIGSNPNLLINGDFAINQRGLSSYINIGYTCDRWYRPIGSTPGTVETAKNQYKYTAISTANFFNHGEQRIDYDFANDVGRTLTLSGFATVTGTGDYRLSIRFFSNTDFTTVISTTEQTITSGAVTKVTATIPSGCVRIAVLLRSHNQVGGDVVNYKWVKLEFGSIATPFVPPLIAEELPKCKLYYRRYNFGFNTPIPLGCGRNATTISINILIPKLRTNPTFLTAGTVKILNAPATGGLTLTHNAYYDGCYRMFILTTGLTEGIGYLLAGETNGYYALDAEIY